MYKHSNQAMKIANSHPGSIKVDTGLLDMPANKLPALRLHSTQRGHQVVACGALLRSDLSPKATEVLARR